MEAAVVDASVVAKWFVDEPYSDVSLRLREDHVNLRIRLIVPYIMRYEVLNALKYSGGFGTQELVRVASSLEDYQFIEVPPDGKYAEETVRIAMDYGLTIYDASYVALGRVRGVTVYTADQRLLEKTEGMAFATHLREYKGPSMTGQEGVHR